MLRVAGLSDQKRAVLQKGRDADMDTTYRGVMLAEEADRRDLLWALQSRVLTDAEMAMVETLRLNLVIQSDVPYMEADKQRELNEALLQQYRLRAIANEGAATFKLQHDGRTLAEGKPGEQPIDAAGWIEQALEVLRAVEWSGNIDGWKTCPLCTADERAHTPDCKLAALIGAKVAE
jgi:hypothetical protein